MLEINGKSTKKMIHDTAVSLIRKGGDQVKLVIRREIRPDKNLGIKDFSYSLCNNCYKYCILYTICSWCHNYHLIVRIQSL